MSAYLDTFPERLPAGERVLWQGRPSWRALARRAFHLPGWATYLGVLLVWYAATALMSHDSARDDAVAILRMTGVALTPLALACLYAWMTSLATIYTITDKRVILRVGIAMPITFNLPFSRIEQAGLKTWPDGHGSIALTLAPTEKMAYLVLWPHTRPWRMARTEPMLRCIPEAAQVAQTLSRALAIAAKMPVPAAADGFQAARAGATVLA